MVKIKIEKVQLPDGKFMVYFFPDPDIVCKKTVDLSREKVGKELYRVDQLDQHNHNASSNHTKDSVDEYIKRVMADITTQLAEIGLAAETDIEKVKGIPIPIW